MNATLDDEERRLLVMFADGCTNETIAGDLRRSVGWVKARRSELCRRVEAPTLTRALLTYAMEGAFNGG